MYDQFKFAARSSEGGLSFPYETKIHIMEHYDNEEMADTVYKPVYEYFNQINLGLLEKKRSWYWCDERFIYGKCCCKWTFIIL